MRHYSAIEREQFLNNFETSGLSCPAFCKEAGVNYSTFRLWLTGSKRPGKKRMSKTGGLVEVASLPGVSASGLGGCVVVDIGDGLSVRFSSETSMEALACFCREVSGC